MFYRPAPPPPPSRDGFQTPRTDLNGPGPTAARNTPDRQRRGQIGHLPHWPSATLAIIHRSSARHGPEGRPSPLPSPPTYRHLRPSRPSPSLLPPPRPTSTATIATTPPGRNVRVPSPRGGGPLPGRRREAPSTSVPIAAAAKAATQPQQETTTAVAAYWP